MPNTQYPDIFRSAVDPPGPQITCGNVMEIGEGRSDFNEDNLSVMFRTNRKVESSGFYIAATCISPAFQDVDGCTPAEPAQPLMGGSPGSGRKRRETEFDSLVRDQYFIIIIILTVASKVHLPSGSGHCKAKSPCQPDCSHNNTRV